MASNLSMMKQAVLSSTLQNTRFFSGLIRSDLEQVAGIAVLKNLTKGEFLFREGEPSSGFYVVQKGAICVHRMSPVGKEQVISIFREGETFAEAALVMPTGYPASARASESSTVILIPKAEFLSVLSRRPDLSLRMLASMSTHLRALVGRLDDLNLKDVETRLANWLIKRGPRSSDAKPFYVEIVGTKRILASELGVASETLSRTFAIFRDQKWIDVHGKRITVLQRSKLQALIRKNLGEH